MYFTTTAVTPLGKWQVIVNAANESDAKVDARAAASSVSSCHLGQITLKDLRRTVRKSINENFHAAKQCTTNGQPWAWINYNHAANGGW